MTNTREGNAEVAASSALLKVYFRNVTQVVFEATRRSSYLGSVLKLIFITKKLPEQIFVQSSRLHHVTLNDNISLPVKRWSPTTIIEDSIPRFIWHHRFYILKISKIYFISNHNVNCFQAWIAFKTLALIAIKWFVSLRFKMIASKTPGITRSITQLKHRIKWRRKRLRLKESHDKPSEIWALFNTSKIIY